MVAVDKEKEDTEILLGRVHIIMIIIIITIILLLFKNYIE